MAVDSLKHKKQQNVRRATRVRLKISGSSDRHRLSVFMSGRNISAQVIDDQSGRTVAYATSIGRNPQLGKDDMALWVGGQIAKKAKAAKVKKVIFDRGSRKYHGKMKRLADAARAEGLEF